MRVFSRFLCHLTPLTRCHSSIEYDSKKLLKAFKKVFFCSPFPQYLFQPDHCWSCFRNSPATVPSLTTRRWVKLFSFRVISGSRFPTSSRRKVFRRPPSSYTGSKRGVAHQGGIALRSVLSSSGTNCFSIFRPFLMSITCAVYVYVLAVLCLTFLQ